MQRQQEEVHSGGQCQGDSDRQIGAAGGFPASGEGPAHGTPQAGCLSDWIRIQSAGGSEGDLGPKQLAWLGDAVWELHQRLRHCRSPKRSVELHNAVVAVVKAEAQARALALLEPQLTESERDLVRRGRNRAGKGPRRGDPAIYGKATGFETMVGWLFLQNPARLAQLLDQLDEADIDLK